MRCQRMRCDGMRCEGMRCDGMRGNACEVLGCGVKGCEVERYNQFLLCQVPKISNFESGNLYKLDLTPYIFLFLMLRYEGCGQFRQRICCSLLSGKTLIITRIRERGVEENQSTSGGYLCGLQDFEVHFFSFYSCIQQHKCI